MDIFIYYGKNTGFLKDVLNNVDVSESDGNTIIKIDGEEHVLQGTLIVDSIIGISSLIELMRKQIYPKYEELNLCDNLILNCWNSTYTLSDSNNYKDILDIDIHGKTLKEVCNLIIDVLNKEVKERKG